jgi:hypothetical protein
MIDQETYNKGGYGKYRLSKEYIEHAKSRAIDGKGRVYTGESGKALLARQKAAAEAEQKKPLLRIY